MSEVIIEIHEGKYHQIKRMMQAVGKKVVALKRLAMGDLVLDLALDLGEYRDLTEAELKSLKSQTDSQPNSQPNSQ